MSATTAEPVAGRSRGKHPVDQILPVPQLALYGFQHVLAFYAGAVIVPILLANAIGLTPEQLGVPHQRRPVHLRHRLAHPDHRVLEDRGAAAAPAGRDVRRGEPDDQHRARRGRRGARPARDLRRGHRRRRRGVPDRPVLRPVHPLLPPVVTGTVITVIGVVLLSVAARTRRAAGAASSPSRRSGRRATSRCAGFTLLVILLMYRFFKGFLSTIAVLIGLVVGTAVGALFGFTDFSRVADADLFGVTTPFYFGTPTFKLAAVISMIIVMIITAVETTGDVFATGEIVKKELDGNDVARAIRADGLATTIGGILNSFPYTCFAENVGLVRLTRVKSRYVVATAGLFMMIIGVFPKIGAIVAAIPLPVLGGAGVVLFGTVAVIGIQTLRRVDFHEESNVIILAVSLGFAIAPTVYPTITSEFSEGVRTIISSGITLGASPPSCSTCCSTCGAATTTWSRSCMPTSQHDGDADRRPGQPDEPGAVRREFGGLFQKSAVGRRAGVPGAAVHRRLRPAQGAPGCGLRAPTRSASSR